MSPRRRQLLDALRAEHTREWACRTPLERFEQLEAMHRLAGAAGTGPGRTDEPLELLRVLRERRHARSPR